MLHLQARAVEKQDSGVVVVVAPDFVPAPDAVAQLRQLQVRLFSWARMRMGGWGAEGGSGTGDKEEEEEEEERDNGKRRKRSRRRRRRRRKRES